MATFQAVAGESAIIMRECIAFAVLFDAPRSFQTLTDFNFFKFKLMVSQAICFCQKLSRVLFCFLPLNSLYQELIPELFALPLQALLSSLIYCTTLSPHALLSQLNGDYFEALKLRRECNAEVLGL